MASSSTGAAAAVRPKMIVNGNRAMPATPTTLAKMEDPRAWHVLGQVGVQRKPTKPTTDAIALPMAPPIPKGRAPRAKKIVLEEDEYVERLGDIIEGDYYPHNAKMHRALSGLARGSGGGGEGTPSRGGFISTPSSIGTSTPGGSTPGREGSGHGGDRDKRAPGTGGALTEFVAAHTSEDNEAFAELQEKDQEAFRRRYFWAYDTADGEGNNATSTKLLILPDGKMMSVERRELMDAACADRPKIGDHRPNQVETWKHRTRNQLMFFPDMAASNDTCRIENQAAPAAPLLLEGANGKPRAKRRLMQSGEGTKGESQLAGRELGAAIGKAKESSGAMGTDAHPVAVASTLAPKRAAREDQEPRRAEEDSTAAPSAETPPDEVLLPASDSKDDAEYIPPEPPSTTSVGETPAAPRAPVVVKLSNPKVIQAHATRFPVPQARPPRQGAWASPIERPSSSRESVAELLKGAADVADYSEVPMTPSRVPGLDGDSPQITWGSIDGTPMILDPRATPLPDGSVAGAVDVSSIIGALGGGHGGGGGLQFKIKDLPAREKLAHSLEAVDTRRKRAKLGNAAGGATGTRTPAAATPLTPRTPGTGKRTPGTERSTGGARTPGTGRSRRTPGATASAVSATAAHLTPAARTLAAKLARRRGVNTPFGGGLTPGRQKRRSGASRRSGVGGKGGGRTPTPLPGTPGGGGGAGSITPVAAAKGKLGAGRGGRSSLTDGLLALK